MGLLGWLKGRREPEGDGRLRAWRERWDDAVRDGSAPGPAASRLRAELDALQLPEEEVEIEREMLDGLEQLGAIAARVETDGLPALVTGHRVVGSDVCHFTAPVSMPDEPSQPGGRLLLTATRAIFVGGANGTTVPWHAVLETMHAGRDLILIRHDRELMFRFRCNSYGDALTGAFLAKRLAGRKSFK